MEMQGIYNRTKSSTLNLNIQRLFLERTGRISLHTVLPGNSVHFSVTIRETAYSGDIALSVLLDFLFLSIPVRQLRSLKLFKTRTCDHTEE